MHALLRRRARSLAVVTVLAGMALSVPVAAHAEIESSVSGAYSTTENARKSVYIKDTAADNHRAEARYKRGSVTATTQIVAATGGNGSTNRTGSSSSLVVLLQACALNNNPLDSQTCDTPQTA